MFSFVNPEAKGLEGVLGGGGAGGLQQVHLIKRGRWNGTSPDSILACQEDGPDQHRLWQTGVSPSTSSRFPNSCLMKLRWLSVIAIRDTFCFFCFFFHTSKQSAIWSRRVWLQTLGTDPLRSKHPAILIQKLNKRSILGLEISEWCVFTHGLTVVNVHQEEELLFNGPSSCTNTHSQLVLSVKMHHSGYKGVANTVPEYLHAAAMKSIFSPDTFIYNGVMLWL